MNRCLTSICCAALLVSGATFSQDSAPPEPEKVGQEAELLLRRVSLDLSDVSLATAMEMMSSFAGVKVEVTEVAGERSVTLQLENATVAEALRAIKDQAGAVHRVEDGELRLALDEEWKRIDAGEAFTKHERRLEPARLDTLICGRERTEIAIDDGERPFTVRIMPDGKKLFVANWKTLAPEGAAKLRDVMGWIEMPAEGPEPKISGKLTQKVIWIVGNKELTEEELKVRHPEQHNLIMHYLGRLTAAQTGETANPGREEDGDQPPPADPKEEPRVPAYVPGP